MIGHGLLTWGIYFHTILLPAPTQLSLYISFMLFMTGMSLFIPPLCQCVVIFISTLFIFTIPTCINPPPLPAFPNLETCDGMATMRFDLLVGPTLLLQTSIPPTPTGWIFLSIYSLKNILALEEEECTC